MAQTEAHVQVVTLIEFLKRATFRDSQEKRSATAEDIPLDEWGEPINSKEKAQ
jgi:hypothetical protein